MSDGPTLEQVALDAAHRAGEAATRGPDGTIRALVDALTVAMAGSVDPVVTRVRDALQPAPVAHGGAAVWFSGESTASGDAAMLNGTAIHVNDFDDTHDAAIVHCMSAVLPAALAGWHDGRADTLRSAVAAGTELACNLALARPRYSGWHYTTLLGALGAALAHAVASGADDDVVADAVGNAYVHLGGNKQVVLDGSIMKRLMPGTSARAGVVSSQLAQGGVGGVSRWLEGEYGLFAHYYGSDENRTEIRGGTRPRIDELSFKPYPACRFTHGAIEAAILLHERLGPDVAAHATGAVVRYPATDRFGIVLRPFEPRGAAEMDAQFSTAFLVASALVNGRVDFSSYTAGEIDDPRVVELAGRVEVVQDIDVANTSALGPIEVSAAGATVTIEEVLGAPNRPVPPGLTRSKFDMCRSRAAALGAPPNRLPTYEQLTTAVDAADGTALLDLFEGQLASP